MKSTRRGARLEQELGRYESGHNAPLRATAAALEDAEEARSVVLVEGISDQIAVETLAARQGVRLEDGGVVVVPAGGAHSIPAHLMRLPPEVTVTGLCDRNEAAIVIAAFVAAGRDTAEVFVCSADLEDELIRATGARQLEEIMATRGELGSFRTLQKQTAWRDRPFDEQAHRWIRSHARRSSVYARVLVETLEGEAIPAPLTGLLARAAI